MNEPKRRGRPPKVKAEAVTQPVVNGDTSRAPEDAMDDQRAKAQAYAMRVWAGQSPDMDRAWRIGRCNAALEGQNLPTEGVEFPA